MSVYITGQISHERKSSLMTSDPRGCLREFRGPVPAKGGGMAKQAAVPLLYSQNPNRGRLLNYHFPLSI